MADVMDWSDPVKASESIALSKEPRRWAELMTSDHPQRRAVLDHAIHTTVPLSPDPEVVSVAIKAFMTADCSRELITVLEAVLTNTTYKDNRNLQNLLFLTCLKADPKRLPGHIHDLDNYDGPDVAKILKGGGRYEEALAIYRKYDMPGAAIEVLVDDLADFDRAKEFATSCNKPDVWITLGHALLSNGRVSEAVESYVKAADHSCYWDDPDVTHKQECLKEIAAYLDAAKENASEDLRDEIQTEVNKIRGAVIVPNS